MVYGIVSQVDDATTKAYFKNKRVPDANVVHMVQLPSLLHTWLHLKQERHFWSHMKSFSHTFVFLHLKRWMQKLCGLLKLPLFHVFVVLCSLTSFEIVVGSLQRNLAISLNDLPSLSDFSMYRLSSSVRCFWFPGINFDIYSLLLMKPETIKQ